MRYAIREWRRFVLTEVTSRPAQLIRRLPKTLILMSRCYLVYDVRRDAAGWRGVNREYRLADRSRVQPRLSVPNAFKPEFRTFSERSPCQSNTIPNGQTLAPF